MSSLVLRSGGMPLLLLCLSACFHWDIPVDMSSLWRMGAAVSVYFAVRLFPERHRCLLLYGFVLWGLVESVAVVFQQTGLLRLAFAREACFGRSRPFGCPVGFVLS